MKTKPSKINVLLLATATVLVAVFSSFTTDKASAAYGIELWQISVVPSPMDEVEKMPEYPGGHQAMVDFIIKNLKYPEAAKKNNVQGQVIISFVVDKNGKVKDVKVVSGIGSGCDEEAVRVVQAMPAWTPGTSKGKAVDVEMKLPFAFKLDDKKK
ncbi:MAG: energy transducer TonB [Bacteroidetes bacterium]|nr:energy transducer TonB [Bacteroidota bacterium]MBU1718650.1 energy transducer TonB [Bacteroidota bacterium]